jgi:hypothetical protein
MSKITNTLSNGSTDRLPADLQVRLEIAFDSHFDDVSIETGVLGQQLTSAIGTISCTDGATLFFAPGCYQPDLSAGRLVIAHELAHVVPKRRGRGDPAAPRVSDRQIETEANRAAIAALSGTVYHCLSAVISSQIRSWGPAGHYYTAYFALKAAGFPDDVASRAAFFCQMPDQVTSLDAKYSGEAWALKTLMPMFVGPAHARNFSANADKLIKIEEGLHCLTGRAARQETEYRVRIIDNKRDKPICSRLLG